MKNKYWTHIKFVIVWEFRGASLDVNQMDNLDNHRTDSLTGCVAIVVAVHPHLTHDLQLWAQISTDWVIFRRYLTGTSKMDYSQTKVNH